MASRYPTRAELAAMFPDVDHTLDDAFGELVGDKDRGERRGRQRPKRKPDPAGVVLRRTWRELQRICFERAGYRCERCGKPRHEMFQFEAHHRKLRSRHGRNELSNLVGLCSDCHRWCHGNNDSAEMAGWIVPSWADPHVRAVTLFDGRMVLFDDEGGYSWEGRPLACPYSTFLLFCRTIDVV